MRSWMLSVLVLVVALPTNAQTEISIGTAVQSTAHMGQDGMQAAFNASARLAVQLFDVSLSANRAQLDKIGTPGGKRWTYSADLRRWVGPNFFMVIGGHRIVSDATVWTKKTWWMDGGFGVVVRYGKKKARLHRDEFELKYSREMSTDAVAPNHTSGLSLRWAHDLPIKRNIFIRSSFSMGFWNYLQDGVRVDGNSSSLGIGVVIRKSAL